MEQSYINELLGLSSARYAAKASSFFKTAPGQYGHGDIFIGARMPDIRKVAGRHWASISISEIEQMMQQPEHEFRMFAFLALASKYEKASRGAQPELYNIYRRNTPRCNNWDLVDCTAPRISGHYAFHYERSALRDAAAEDSLWANRIAMVSCLYFIRQKELGECFIIAEMLLGHTHDLIHKSTGWMLREAGKASRRAMLQFLERNYCKMPRTALRYAIEHLSTGEKKKAMKGDFSFAH
jgi:3-methyladenine DNA glycosylase AlkD